MSKLKKRRVIIIVIMVILIAAAIGTVVYKINEMVSAPLFDSGIKQNSAISNMTKAGDKSFNALLIGTDAAGENTDALMIVHVDKQDKKIRMLSIPRDTRVTVDGKKFKINAAIIWEGLNCSLKKSVS